ncbi:acyl-CoA N-acyltransferase [Chytriomyces sp. MP71]|nr:acyl-CoA N-acyltransferase [Chytriomyces sp. MP71]
MGSTVVCKASPMFVGDTSSQPHHLHVVAFPSSNAAALERAYAIRLEVFANEQGFDAAIDKDELDAISTHFLLFVSPEDTSDLSRATGVARLFTYEAEEGTAKIGRVAVRASARMKGAGKALMQGVEDEARRQGFKKLKLHAQTHAMRFYTVCGYQPVGEIFLEEGADHIAMIKRL